MARAGGRGNLRSSSRSFSNGRNHIRNHTYTDRRRSRGTTFVTVLLFLSLFILCLGGQFLGIGSTYERKLTNYADTAYETAFSRSEKYENNILFLYIVDDNFKKFDAISWVGDDVDYLDSKNVDATLITQCITEDNYKTDLATGISESIRKVAETLSDTSTRPTPIHSVINKSKYNVDCEQIELTLENFENYHEYGTAVVIADREDVYGKFYMNSITECLVAFLIILIVVGFVLYNTWGKKYLNQYDDEDDYDPYNAC